jgi:hypothetical protein
MKSRSHKILHGWKKFARRVGRIQTIILVTLFYFLILAPIGALFRLFGWDPLLTRAVNSKNMSNWKEVTDKSPDFESLKRQS